MAVATQPGAAPDLLPRLTGTIIGASGYRAAVLLPAGGHSVTVREGDESGGLRIVQISPGQVVAENAAGRFVLQVRYGDKQPTANAPLAQAMPPPADAPAKDPREHGPGEQDE